MKTQDKVSKKLKQREWRERQKRNTYKRFESYGKKSFSKFSKNIYISSSNSWSLS